MVVVFIIAGILPLWSGFREFMRARVARWNVPLPDDLVAILGAWSLAGISWIILEYHGSY
jgi:hypothetical protein